MAPVNEWAGKMGKMIDAGERFTRGKGSARPKPIFTTTGNDEPRMGAGEITIEATGYWVGLGNDEGAVFVNGRLEA